MISATFSAFDSQEENSGANVEARASDRVRALAGLA
jgi:hypothetical protein